VARKPELESPPAFEARWGSIDTRVRARVCMLMVAHAGHRRTGYPTRQSEWKRAVNDYTFEVDGSLPTLKSIEASPSCLSPSTDSILIRPWQGVLAEGGMSAVTKWVLEDLEALHEGEGAEDDGAGSVLDLADVRSHRGRARHAD
jgi:hypothetical protein